MKKVNTALSASIAITLQNKKLAGWDKWMYEICTKYGMKCNAYAARKENG
jgi:hypothetical protein